MKVVHCKRDSYDTYIGRPSRWGNPFEIGKDGNREEVIAKYREWVVKQPELMASLHELEGKVLGCWCSPNACHGDVLIELVAAQAKPDKNGWRKSGDGLWYSDGLSHEDVATAPYGFQFNCLYAPRHSLKGWTIMRFEVKKVYDNVRKYWYRAYVVKERMELEQAPFELPMQEDNSEAWLSYIETGKASKEVAEILPTLGSYAA